MIKKVGVCEICERRSWLEHRSYWPDHLYCRDCVGLLRSLRRLDKLKETPLSTYRQANPPKPVRWWCVRCLEVKWLTSTQDLFDHLNSHRL